MMFVPWRLPGQCLTHRLLPAPLLQQVRQGMEHNWNRWSTAAVPLSHDSGCTSSHPQRPWHLGSSRDPSCPLCGLLMATEGCRHLETHFLLQSPQEVCSQMNHVNSNPVWAQTEQQQRDGKELRLSKFPSAATNSNADLAWSIHASGSRFLIHLN